MMYPRACPRCHGTQYTELDEMTKDWALVCLNCGGREPMRPTIVEFPVRQAIPDVLAGPRRGLRAV